ncbi:MAG: YitT family protein, partial [Thermodesulfobacteriota bacterium]
MKRRTKLMQGTKRALGKKELLVTYPSIIAGGLIWSIAINGILIHNQFLSGGVSGFALLVHYLFRFLPLGLMVFLMNIPIFALGWAMISGKFFALSLMGMLSFSFFLTVTTWLHIPIDNPLLAALFAGVISGVGSGLVFRSGGSGGGSGIIAMVLNRHLSVRVGMVSFALNSVPLILGALLVNLNAALYSIIYVYVSGSVTDRILTGFNERRSVFIISEKSSEIAEEVLDKLHRGATFFRGEGAYTHTASKIVYCVVPLFEL